MNQFTVAFSWSQLLAALKSTSIANSPKLIADAIGVLFGWIAASLVFLISSSPYLAIFSGILPTIVNYIQNALLPTFPGLSISIQSVTLTKAWDMQALASAFKAVGIGDAEVFIESDVNTIFQWLQAGLALGNSYEQLFSPLVQSLATLVDSELSTIAKSV